MNPSEPDAENEVGMRAAVKSNGIGVVRPDGSSVARPYNEPAPFGYSSRSLERELPEPPMVYQQARQVYIKRKAVPGQQTAPQAAPAAYRKSKLRFSWMD